jgi:hypothetical protein
MSDRALDKAVWLHDRYWQRTGVWKLSLVRLPSRVKVCFRQLVMPSCGARGTWHSETSVFIYANHNWLCMPVNTTTRNGGWSYRAHLRWRPEERSICCMSSYFPRRNMHVQPRYPQQLRVSYKSSLSTSKLGHEHPSIFDLEHVTLAREIRSPELSNEVWQSRVGFSSLRVVTDLNAIPSLRYILYPKSRHRKIQVASLQIFPSSWLKSGFQRYYLIFYPYMLNTDELNHFLDSQ